ncbi:hypothetical protein Mapa_002880 [Marchantia paleacea]|nr:hypothetical protein Mapa_002880 [Marchantia paleacea]
MMEDGVSLASRHLQSSKVKHPRLLKVDSFTDSCSVESYGRRQIEAVIYKLQPQASFKVQHDYQS